ncbi:hypothetical protein AB0M28_34425 [Streptomyces sp. NPDC051940]|uniref:hypothetical protein n=1 Tax=Streptomyces sp. NPDC051940 TaxID=3155675 RepID=UPI0034286775
MDGGVAPLPPVLADADAPAWTGPDAERWLRAGREPLWADAEAGVVLATVVGVMVLLSAGNGPGGADWAGMALMALAALLILEWIERLPLLAVLGLVVLAVGVQYRPEVPGWSRAVAALAAGCVFVGCVRRLWCGRMRRRVVTGVAGELRRGMPEGARIRNGSGLGCLLIMLAGLGAWAWVDDGALDEAGFAAGVMTAVIILGSRPLIWRVRAVRAAAVRRSGVPVVRVVVVVSGEVNDREADVFAVDDLRRPLVRGRIHAGSAGPREALLYGVPGTDAGCGLVFLGDERAPGCVVTTPLFEVRFGEPERYETEVPEPQEEPVRWGPDVVQVLQGSVLVALAAGAVAWAPVQGQWGASSVAVSALFVLPVVLPLLTWRITADRTGVEVRTLLRSRRMAWEELTEIRGGRYGLVLATAPRSRGAYLFRIRAWPWLYQVLRVRPSPRAAEAGLRAMHADPALRPARDAVRRRRRPARVVGGRG